MADVHSTTLDAPSGPLLSQDATQVGYEYPTNFTYAFKKRFGCLPRTWKKQN